MNNHHYYYDGYNSGYSAPVYVDSGFGIGWGLGVFFLLIFIVILAFVFCR
jgi:uncharacterized membrane protein